MSPSDRDHPLRKNSAEILFPDVYCPALEVVYAHTSGKILSHSAVTRADNRGTRESSIICLFLIGPASCCGCPASSAADAADTRLSRCLESCFNAVKIRSLRFPKNWGFDESRICRFWLLAYSLILLCSSLVWLIELSFPRRVSAGVRAPLWGAGHWA